MTFTRTASGVANYNKFFGSDIVVFSEGKDDADEREGVVRDQDFYVALFKSINPKWIVKVKCVGNKGAALDYVAVVKEVRHCRCLVAIDKDSIGITSSYIEAPEVILTHGYSWENDLFVERLALDVLADVTRGDSRAARTFSEMFSRTMKRLRFLSALDVSCQVDGKALLKKSSRTGGVTFKRRKGTLISHDEISRLIKKYRSLVGECPIVREIRSVAYRSKPQEVIQGHIWECAVRQLVSAAAENALGIQQLPAVLFSNLMLGKFGKNPAYYLGDEVFRYYRLQILTRVS